MKRKCNHRWDETWAGNALLHIECGKCGESYDALKHGNTAIQKDSLFQLVETLENEAALSSELADLEKPESLTWAQFTIGATTKRECARRLREALESKRGQR